MLEFLRKHTAIVMAAVALVFIGLVFFNDGNLTGTSSGSEIAKVDGTAYTAKDYNEKYERMHSIAARNGIPAVSIPLFGLDWESFGKKGDLFLLASVLVNKEAERLGIVVTKEETDQFIKHGIPVFLNDNGTFNTEIYQQRMSYGGKSYMTQNENALRDVVADLILYYKIIAIMDEGIEVNNSFSHALTESIWQKMEVNTAFLNEADFKPKEDPTDEQIKEFWKNREKNYLSEETRNIDLYVFKPKAAIERIEGVRIPQATTAVLNEIEVLEGLIYDANGNGYEELIAESSKNNEGLYSMTKSSFENVAKRQAPDELKATLNPAAGSPKETLIETAFDMRISTGAKMIFDASGNLIGTEPSKENTPAKFTNDNISSALVLEDGTVALLVIRNVTPAAPLKYEQAKNSARTDLINQMTGQAMEKTANELREKLIAEGKTSEQFKKIAEAANASVSHYESISASNYPTDMIAGAQVFESLRKVNNGGISDVITSQGKGATIAQLVKRTIDDSPFLAQIKGTQTSGYTISTKHIVITEWFDDCLKRYNVQYDSKNQGQ